MKEKLVIVGIGSLAPEVYSFVKKYSLYEVIGFSVDQKYVIDSFEGLPVYPLEKLESYVDKDTTKVFVAISWFNKFNKFKREKFENLKARGFHFANLISPNAIVSTESIGEGNWIHDGAIIDYGVKIGNNNNILLGVLVGHYSSLGDHNVLAGRANIAGDTSIGNGCYFGLASIVFNRLSLGDYCLVGGGSIVRKDLPDYSIVTSPESINRKGSLRLMEMIMSPIGIQMIKESK